MSYICSDQKQRMATGWHSNTHWSGFPGVAPAIALINVPLKTNEKIISTDMIIINKQINILIVEIKLC